MNRKVEILEERNETTGCANGIGKYECSLSWFQEEHCVEIKILVPN